MDIDYRCELGDNSPKSHYPDQERSEGQGVLPDAPEYWLGTCNWGQDEFSISLQGSWGRCLGVWKGMSRGEGRM